ncbi:helix-turn-helix transcriptional regulator [Bradyrhizobium sp. McL0616]|uniref:helix-turn-helix transcriptional regulator n=1 Tax=Bradyrhizobium sp. McL0616 TaxID=3415674 RepID=UPI003CEDC851
MGPRTPPAQRSPYPGGKTAAAAPGTPDTVKRTPQQPRAPPGERFLRVADVVGITSLSRSEIYRRVQLGEFPQPVKIGIGQSGRTVWLETEIANWMHERVAEWREQTPV